MTGNRGGGSLGTTSLAKGEPIERSERGMALGLLVSGVCPLALRSGCSVGAACAPEGAAGPSDLAGSGEEFGHKSL